MLLIDCPSFLAGDRHFDKQVVELFSWIHLLVLVLENNYALALVESEVDYLLPVSHNQHLSDLGQRQRNQPLQRLDPDSLIDFCDGDELFVDEAGCDQIFEVGVCSFQRFDQFQSLCEGSYSEFQKHEVP